MNQTTWGVKITEELKQKLTKLIEESGLTAKDFIEELVQVYEAQKTKEVVPAISSDIEEVQTLTKRLVDIYLNMGQKVLNLQKAKDEEYAKAIAQKDSLIASLQDKIAELQEENKKFNAQIQELVNSQNELKSKVDQLEEVNQKNNDLIAEYRQKIESLTGLVDEYKGFEKENKALRNEIDKLKVDLEAKDREIKELKDSLAFDLKQANIEKEKTVLELKKHHQDEIQKLQDEYTAKIRALQEQVDKLLKEKEESLRKLESKRE
jgi:chromosome segregation ATPase